MKKLKKQVQAYSGDDNCADDDDGDDDDDVKKKLGVVEGAFALLWPVEVDRSPTRSQTGSGDGSKEVLLLYYCPVTKLFGHDGYDCDDDGDDDDDIYIMMKCMSVCLSRF